MNVEFFKDGLQVRALIPNLLNERKIGIGMDNDEKFQTINMRKSDIISFMIKYRIGIPSSLITTS